MTYAILGSGAIGHALAVQFARAGVDVLLANSRGPESLAEVVRELGPHVRAVSAREALSAELVILAVPFAAIAGAVASAPRWRGRIAVDASNAIDFPAFTPTDLGGVPSTQVVARSLPGARVVKAFNTLPAAVLAADPRQHDGRRALFVSGDVEDANLELARLVERLGFFPIVLGKLSAGGLLQQFGGPLTVHSLIRQDSKNAS